MAEVRNPWVAKAAIFLILWLLPLLAVHDAKLRATADDDQRLVQTLVTRLDDDWARCERILDPTTPIALGFQRRLEALSQRAASSGDPGLFVHSRVQKEMAALTRRWRKAAWVVVTQNPPSAGGSALPASGPPVLITSAGFPRTASSPRVLGWFASIRREFGLDSGDPSLPGVVDLSDQASAVPTFGLIRQSWGTFVRFKLAGAERLQVWLPLVRPLPSGVPVAESEEWSRLRAGLWGAFMLWLDPAEVQPGDGFRFLGQQLAEDGCMAAFIPRAGAATMTPWLHPAFRRDPMLRRLVTRGGDGIITQDGTRGWQVVVRRNLFGLPCRVVLARPWQKSGPRSPGSGKVATGAAMASSGKAGKGWGLIAADGWTAMWLVLGGLVLVRASLGRALPRIPLRWQMCGAFLLILLPALVLSSVTIERSFAARRTQTESAQRRILADRLAAVDAGRQVYLGWSCGVVERFISRPGFIRQLVALESLPKTARVSASFALMDRFVQAMKRRGIFMRTPVFTGSEEFYAEVPNAFDRAVEPFIYQVLRQYSNRALQQLGRRPVRIGDQPSNQGREMIVGLFLDDARNIMLGLMSAEHFAALTVAPRYLEEITNFGRPSWVFLTYLRHPSGFRYCFLMTVETTWLDALWVTACPEFRPDPGGDLPSLSIGLRGDPAVTLVPPFWRLQPDLRYGGDDVVPLLDVPAEPLMELAALAPGAFTPILQRAGAGSSETLQLARPGRFMAGVTLFASTPLGRLLAVSDADLARAGMLLLGLLLLSAVLALQAAAAFLRPVAALVEAARGIMAGQFSGRLPVLAGGEFAILAQAFNAMAAGVESGRRLRRFVSGSVRDAARDADRHQTALAGELRSAVIVFAGVNGFSHLSRTVPAPRLIEMVNRHLRALSPIIRSYGGDIDKFIGDRILAVFPVDPTRGPGEAVRAATAAAAEMQRAAAAGEEWQRPLGIGIVLGDVLAGIMGTPEVRLEFTVIGDTVNLASRLADLAMLLDASGEPVAGNPVGGTVIDDAAWQVLPDPSAWRRLRLPPIRGKSRAVGAHWAPPPGFPNGTENG